MNKEAYLHKDLQPFLTCTDFMVSKERFSLLKNEEYQLLITDPAPENTAPYYKSDTYISHTNNRKTLLDKVYQLARTIALKKKVRLLNSFQTAEKTVLDIGCGTGDFLQACQQQQWTVFGVEPNTGAREKAQEKKLNIYENLAALPQQKFDVITLWHVLEHVPNLTEYCSQLQSLLKPNGTLVVAVPNFKSYDALHYKSYWAAYDTPRHLWHFSRTAIRLLFASEQMDLVQTIPMKLDAYYVSLLSEKNKHQRFRPLHAFWIGLLSNLKARRSQEASSHVYLLRNK